MRTLLTFAGTALLVTGCGGDGGGTPPATTTPTVRAAGYIDRFELVSTVDAFNGATPAGAAGPYSVVTGIVHGKLDPKAADNAGIVDLDKVTTDANGYVDYTTDVVILRPKSAANARRVLFYDVVNRGNKLGQGVFVGGGALASGAAPDSTITSILSRGYTVVWSGWQGDVAQTGNGATAAVGTAFPTAKNADGTSITGLSREEYVPDFAGTANVPLTYVPASTTDLSEVTFTARATYRNAAGQQTYASPSTPVTTWSYVTSSTGAVSVQFTAPATIPDSNGNAIAPDTGTIYNFTYRAKDPKVMGIGFAAVRDLVSFLRNKATDAQGNANPVADMKNAPCAAGTGCASAPTTNYDLALGEGISQSGRFLRDFLYQGFNKDVDAKVVFDALMPIIPAGRRTWVNYRFAQPGRWSKEHEDHFMPGDQFPFTYAVTTDPVGGATDGLFKACLATSTCPKVMQIDGTYEWWGGRASLVTTDGAGHDLTLPDNVRYYVVVGTGHGGGAGVTTGIVTQPAAGSTCQFAGSPVSESQFERALLPALENWVVKGTNPPASKYPTVAAGNLVAPTAAGTGFPDLSTISVPSGATATPVTLNVALSRYNQLYVTDYGSTSPSVNLAKAYTVLVPKVDANGNELGGLIAPEVAVPLATYAGWNVRAAGHTAGENCQFAGSAIPFATSPATKAATDPRTTLSQLYAGKTDYLTKFGAAADALVTAGYVMPADAATYKSGAAAISSALISAP